MTEKMPQATNPPSAAEPAEDPSPIDDVHEAGLSHVFVLMRVMRRQSDNQLLGMWTLSGHRTLAAAQAARAKRIKATPPTVADIVAEVEIMTVVISD